MARIGFLVASLLSLSASASVVRHVPARLCCGWEESPLLSDAVTSIDLTFYLKESNSEKLKAEALAVSDPSSPRYGQHLSRAEIYSLTAPTRASLDTVTSWLSAANVTHRVAHDRRVHATMELGAASALLNTQFVTVAHAERKVALTRAGAYELPADVDAATAAVFGLHGLPLPPRTTLVADKEPAKVTPAVLGKTYSERPTPTPEKAPTTCVIAHMF